MCQVNSQMANYRNSMIQTQINQDNKQDTKETDKKETKH
jgi:hypothetical protein